MRGSSASHYAVILRLSVAKDKHFCINFILIIRKHYDSKKPFPIMVLDAVKSGWYMIFKASSTMRRLCSPRILMTAPVPQKSCSKALRRSKTALLFCHMLILAGWS